VPIGASTILAIFTEEGGNPPHVANGTLVIYMNDEKIGESKFRTSRASSRLQVKG
jgi:hypothetical protein